MPEYDNILSYNSQLICYTMWFCIPTSMRLSIFEHIIDWTICKPSYISMDFVSARHDKIKIPRRVVNEKPAVNVDNFRVVQSYIRLVSLSKFIY